MRGDRAAASPKLVRDLLENSADREPEKLALVTEQDRLTYGTFSHARNFVF